MILADISESVERRGEVRVSHDDAVAERPEHESAEHDPDGALPHKTAFYVSLEHFFVFTAIIFGIFLIFMLLT